MAEIGTDFLEISKEFVGVLKDFFSQSDISNMIGGTSNIITLLQTSYAGLEKFRIFLEKRQQRSLSPEQKALQALFTAELKISEKVISEIDNDTDFKEKQDMKKILDELCTPLGDFDRISYLPEHSAVRRFREKMVYYLRKAGWDLDSIDQFIGRFVIEIEQGTRENVDLKNYYSWWTANEEYYKIQEYLTFVKSYERDYHNQLDKKFLYEYYIPNNAIELSTDIWNSIEKSVSRQTELDTEEVNFYDAAEYQKEIFPIDQIVGNFLNRNNKERFKVVAAPFGIGKTSVSRMIVAGLAEKYLKRERLPVESNLDALPYMPILVFLKNGFSNVYNGLSLNGVLENIVAGKGQKKDRPILLILDGLDEYPNKISDLRKKIDDEWMPQYTGMKIMVTTRPEAGFPDKLLITKEKGGIGNYIRLLEFDERESETDRLNQIMRFYDKCETIDAYEWTKRCLKKIQRTKPLFCWMISLLYSENKYRIKLNDFTENNAVALLYMFFFHYLIAGKYKDKTELRDVFLFEKNVLRKIAVLRRIYPDLDEDSLHKGLGILGISTIDNKKLEQTLKPIMSAYFKSWNRSTSEGTKKIFDFLHRSFQEYLIAEFYLQNILENKSKRKYLNTGNPSKPTIEFLKGITNLIFSTKHSKIAEFIHDGKESLMASFGYKELENFRNKIISNSKTMVEDDSIIFLNTNLNPIEEVKNNPVKEDLTSIDEEKYKQTWIERWIALTVISSVNKTKKKRVVEVDKDKLYKLLINTSRLVNHPLRFLYDVDLSGVDLSRFVFPDSSLSHVNLSGADLSHGLLSRANLSGANLSGADLSHADLLDVNLSGANLSGADLSHADLSGANLSGADLSHADLSGANLFNSIMIGIRSYVDLIADNTDFTDCTVDDKTLVEYLKNQASISPEIIHDKKELIQYLKKRGEDEVTIEKIIVNSIFADSNNLSHTGDNEIIEWKEPGTERIWYATFDGNRWTAQQNIPKRMTSHSPALAVFQDKVMMMWKGKGIDERIWYATFDGNRWTAQQNIPKRMTSHSPALAVFQDKVMMTWKEPGTERIWYATFDGNEWTEQKSVLNATTSHSPALAVFQDKVMMTWKEPGTERIWYATFDGNEWTEQKSVLNATTSHSPALAVFQDKVMMMWKGKGIDERIWYATFDGNRWTAQQNIPKRMTSHSPALAVFQDKVMMTWKEPGTERIWYATFDGNEWTEQKSVLNATTSHSPALAVFQDKVMMTWTGRA